jgi:peroxiredoxin
MQRCPLLSSTTLNVVRLPLPMPKPIWMVPLLAALAAGCTEGKVARLASDNGKLTLSYACTDTVPRVLDGGAGTLVRDIVVRETSEHVIAARGGSAESNDVRAARARGDMAALERAVARYVCAHGTPPTRPPRFPEMGSTPPDFVLEPWGAAKPAVPTRLSDLKGRAVVLVFWSTWCKACREEYRVLQELAARAGTERVSTYAILNGDTEATLRVWQEEHGSGVPFIADPDERIARLYRVYGIPYTLVVRPDGRVHAAGHVSAGKLKSVVAEALGRSPA